MTKIKPIDLYAFWAYDLYPYVCGGEVIKLNAEGLVYAPDYQGWFRPLRLLPVEAGEALQARLDTLAALYKADAAALRAQYDASVFALLPEARCP